MGYIDWLKKTRLKLIRSKKADNIWDSVTYMDEAIDCLVNADLCRQDCLDRSTLILAANTALHQANIFKEFDESELRFMKIDEAFDFALDVYNGDAYKHQKAVAYFTTAKILHHLENSTCALHYARDLALAKLHPEHEEYDLVRKFIQQIS